jgi:hypothetical protein
MEYSRQNWPAIIAIAVVVALYIRWLGSHDGAPAAAASPAPTKGSDYGTNSDLDDLMDAATPGATSVTIAGEEVQF